MKKLITSIIVAGAMAFGVACGPKKPTKKPKPPVTKFVVSPGERLSNIVCPDDAICVITRKFDPKTMKMVFKVRMFPKVPLFEVDVLLNLRVK